MQASLKPAGESVKRKHLGRNLPAANVSCEPPGPDLPDRCLIGQDEARVTPADQVEQVTNLGARRLRVKGEMLHHLAGHEGWAAFGQRFIGRYPLRQGR